MPQFAVITPSYGPDHPLFAELHRSVLEMTPEDVVHYVVVPSRDHDMFAAHASRRCIVLDVEELLPRRIRHAPGTRYLINMRRPWPPIRGWIAQQVVKFAAIEQIGTDLVLVADSDLSFVRPVVADTFATPAGLRLFRKPDGVDASLPEHVRWHQVARTLLGLPSRRPPLPDYISALMFVDRALALRMLTRVETVAGRPWVDVLSGQLHFSEWTLYGVFAEETSAIQREAFSDSSLCHSWWAPRPMTPDDVTDFVASLPPDSVAVHLQSTSRIPIATRREVERRIRAIAR